MRPQPRKSELAGNSPVSPAPISKGSAESLVTAQLSSVSPHKAPTTKITVTLSEDIAEEARAAYWKTAATTGKRSFSTWVEDAIALKLEVDRKAFNDGLPFEGLPPGQIPTGRRI